MSKSDYEVRVVPSVFDRLMDDDPENSRDVIPSRAEGVRNLRRSVQRDLEQLLNTRNPLSDLSDAFEHVRRSVMAYGLPDFSAYNVRSPSDQARMREQVTVALQTFEGRLTDIVVSLVPGADSDRMLRLHVDARLIMDPAPEPITFDIVMPLTSRSYEVRGTD